MPVVPRGSTVTLICNATGNPKPALSWNFNGQMIIPSSEIFQISLSVSFFYKKTRDLTLLRADDLTLSAWKKKTPVLTHVWRVTNWVRLKHQFPLKYWVFFSPNFLICFLFQYRPKLITIMLI